jgi:hypothetical protein
MITIDQLNAISGRPSELQWHPIAEGTAFELDRPDTGHWFIRVKADASALKFYLSTYPATPTELLAFATYIRRVEIEIERMKEAVE